MHLAISSTGKAHPYSGRFPGKWEEAISSRLEGTLRIHNNCKLSQNIDLIEEAF